MGIFKRVANFVQQSGDKRRAAKQKRLETRVAGKSDRAMIDSAGTSERAAIAAANGYDPSTISAPTSKLEGFLGKAKDFVGGILGGGGEASTVATVEQPKDNKNMIMIIGVGVAAVLAFFAFKKEKIT